MMNPSTPGQPAQSFGEMLRQFRLRAKLTQLQLMFRMHRVGYEDLVPSTIANWELGYRLPNADVVYYLAKALRLTPEEEGLLVDVLCADFLYRNLKVYYDLKRGEE